MAAGQQVKNGKAFEYALLKTYADFLMRSIVNIHIEENSALTVAMNFFNQCSEKDQTRFCEAAFQTIGTIIKLEPGIISQRDSEDVLHIFLNDDSKGEDGDVRDIIFRRENPAWELGFSAKNNNDAVKHSRLSSTLDFGKSWVGVPCSQSYWDEISHVFEYLGETMKEFVTWDELGENKNERVYLPMLQSFKNELTKINSNNPNIPKKLIQYLIGKHPFYKIIKDDTHNMVIVKAFNLEGKLNKSVNEIKSRYLVPKIDYPTRIVEFEMKPNSCNTLNMILDNGWEISFRIHNAKTNLEKSLKFDIRLLGNPPILFTQYLFQDN